MWECLKYSIKFSFINYNHCVYNISLVLLCLIKCHFHSWPTRTSNLTPSRFNHLFLFYKICFLNYYIKVNIYLSVSGFFHLRLTRLTHVTNVSCFYSYIKHILFQYLRVFIWKHKHMHTQRHKHIQRRWVSCWGRRWKYYVIESFLIMI